MREIKLKGVRNGAYDLQGNILFKTQGTDIQYIMSQKDALEIVYTLYDSLNLPYTEPDKLAELIESE